MAKREHFDGNSPLWGAASEDPLMFEIDIGPRPRGRREVAPVNLFIPWIFASGKRDQVDNRGNVSFMQPNRICALIQQEFEMGEGMGERVAGTSFDTGYGVYQKETINRLAVIRMRLMGSVCLLRRDRITCFSTRVKSPILRPLISRSQYQGLK